MALPPMAADDLHILARRAATVVCRMSRGTIVTPPSPAILILHHRLPHLLAINEPLSGGGSTRRRSGARLSEAEPDPCIAPQSLL
jgi:hypothetical protein